MLLQAGETTAATAAATNETTTSSVFQGDCGVPSIAVLVLGGGAMPPEGSQEYLLLRKLTTHFATDFDVSNVLGANITDSSHNRIVGFASERMSEFAAFLRRNKSEKTAQGYLCDVKRVLSDVSAEHFGGVTLNALDLSQVTDEQIKAVEQAIFKRSDSKPQTLSRLKQGWNSFCRFVGMNDWIFTEQINTSREYKEDVISNNSVLKMLEYCRKQQKSAKTVAIAIRWYRIEIAILLGWDMGFRSCEYGNATFDAIETDDKITITHSKHNGTRTITVTAELKAVALEFKAFLLKHNRYPSGGGVFEKADGECYSTSTFRRWLRKASDACDVPAKKSKTHGLRHRFAKNFYSHTHDDFMLADLMGHKSVATTRKYAAATIENMRDAVQASANKAHNSDEAQAA